MKSGSLLKSFAMSVLLTISAAPAFAAACGTGSFEAWLEDFKKEAAAKGISQAAIAAGLNGVALDKAVLARDHSQKVFSQSFEEFSGRMVPPRLTRGSNMLKQYGSVLGRIEQTYGVPGEVLVAIWGLETDYGVNIGKFPTMRSLATLAYDCRRSDMFRAHLFDSLRIVERGDLRPEEMIGSWAGELGQTQFMPSEYMAHAVDYDGDGHRNLIKSVPDVIGSTGRYLVHLGWKRGEPWLQEVRLPADLKWQEADLTIQHPRSQWARWGITRGNGPLQSDNLQASLVLPMGRFGPAFLAYDNFQAYLKWNASLMYSLTAAYYATRLEGAPAMYRGSPNIPKLTIDENRELQQILQRRGYDVGRVDGVLGLKSRSAVREIQIKLGQPADSWPTPELLQRLRGGV
jgi:lytic murein transglycosylase